MTLSKGNSGDAVFALQRHLTWIGYDLLPDGSFGSITKLAVEMFQESVSLPKTGIFDDATAARLSAAVPKVGLRPIYWEIMYGLGDASTSAGMDVFGAALRASSPRFIVSPKASSWSGRETVKARIKSRGSKSLHMIAGNSMGANAIPMVTNELGGVTFLFAVGFDPTIWWSCPKFVGRNVDKVLLFHGVNWFNPIGHAMYSADRTPIETVNTSTTHVAIDDDLGLHKIAINRAIFLSKAA